MRTLERHAFVEGCLEGKRADRLDDLRRVSTGRGSSNRVSARGLQGGAAGFLVGQGRAASRAGAPGALAGVISSLA